MTQIDASRAGDGPAHANGKARAGFGLLTLGSIGVVFGDIGTSPLLRISRGGHGRGRR
jgi:KUP system potassium uptake protein